jgi:hypothetical protein
MFDELIKKYSVEELHDFINAKFKLSRGKTIHGNQEMEFLKDGDAYSLDHNFYRQDRLSFVFSYNSDWSNITRFYSDIVYIPAEF